MATFKDKLNSAGFGLAPSQEDALIRIMRDERLRPLTEEEDPELYVLSTSLPEERGLKQQQIELLRQQQLNRRYLEQAKTILTPEQLVVYEEYLNQWQDLRTKYVEYMPSPEVEAHDRATVELARSDAVSTGPVTVGAAGSEPQQWGDDPNGSSSIVYRTGGNLLGVEFSPGSGWGTGLTFQPQHTAMNEDESADASGVTRLVARLKAPAGATLRFGLLESGADWSGAATFPGAKGADGEAFRHEGVTTLDGWQVYTIPLSELKLNGGYGNQRGNRRIDTQAIKGIEILAPGGQAAFGMEIDYVRIE